MSYQLLRTEDRGRVRVITIDRPKALNALSSEVLLELARAVAEAEGSPEVLAVVLTGAGDKAFVAGADVLAMQSMTAQQAKGFSELGHATFSALEVLHKPVIAAVNGFALGGGLELALACDFIYCSEGASFGQPEVNLGLIPGFGGTQRLSRRVGPAVARELIFSGRRIDAQEALRIGLVNRTVPGEELLDAAVKTATEIARRSPVAIAAAKRVMVVAHDLPLDIACELEIREFALLFGTADQQEGIAAFVEKRKPEFKGE